MIRLSVAAVVLALALSGSRADDKKNPPLEPFNGQDLKGWKLKDEKKNQWRVMRVTVNDTEPNLFSKSASTTDPYELVNVNPGGCDIYTETKFGDVTVELEVMIPKGANSGVYLMGEYEVQIFDSFGKADDKLGQGDMGALYGTAAPKKNASKKPGEWQKFVIEFQGPKFHADKKVSNAKFVKVTLNDVVLHENVEVKGPTTSALTGKEAASGPLMLQGDHGPVAFRNIKITPKK